MILPNKHIKISESIIGISGILINLLKSDKSVDQLWHEYLKFCKESNIQMIQSFDNFIFAIDLLFILDAIKVDKKGNLINAAN